MVRNKILLLVFAAFLMAFPMPGYTESKPDAGLVWVLPDLADLDTLKPEDKPQQAKSEGLYDLINGGASTYLSNGFKQALLQDYRSKSGILFNLEVYQMDTAANAKKVFNIKASTIEKKDTVGQGSCLEDYYGLYWQGTFFITITASQSDKEAQKLFKQIAQKVIKKISEKDSKTGSKK